MYVEIYNLVELLTCLLKATVFVMTKVLQE